MKKTLDEVGNIVGIEGIGYAISEYLNGQDIEDEFLSKLWIEAQDIIQSIEDYLTDNLGSDFFDNF